MKKLKENEPGGLIEITIVLENGVEKVLLMNHFQAARLYQIILSQEEQRELEEKKREKLHDITSSN